MLGSRKAIIGLLLLASSSCSMGPAISELTATLTSTPEDARETSTTTPPHRTTATPSPSPFAGTREGGSLWVHLAGTTRYLVIDMTTGSARNVTHPAGCDPGALPGGTRLVCAGPDTNVSLYDLLSGSSERLAFESQDWVVQSPDGRALLSLGLPRSEEDQRPSFHVYDLDRGQEEIWIPDIAYDDLWNGPVLSIGGQRLAFIAHTPDGGRVFELPTGSVEPSEVGLPVPMPGGALAWSPAGLTLAYGALDYVSEIGLTPSSIYVVNVETAQVTRLAEAPDGGLYDAGFEWSPDGSMIAAGSSPSICVIEVQSATQRCEQIAGDSVPFKRPTWSPGGGYLATVTGEAWWIRDAALVLIDVETLRPTTILRLSEGVDALFWR